MLAVIGLYGLTSYMVARRRKEIGIQTAPLAKFLRGEVRVIAATPGVRHLRLGLNVPSGSVGKTAAYSR
ncbi:MAG TPA: hypothetical protein VIK32_03940 [Candidatus Limnocylindrales bacterium]